MTTDRTGRFKARFDLHPDHCPDVLGIEVRGHLVSMTQFTDGIQLHIHEIGRPECEELIKACESRIKYLEGRNETNAG